MKKHASEQGLHAAAAAVASGDGPRARLASAFLQKLPAQLELAEARWEQAARGDAEAHRALSLQLQTLKGEAAMLQLSAHGHLLSALKETLGQSAPAEPLLERVSVAMGVALRACGELEPHDVVRAEQQAAQLRWLTQDSEAMASGIFPRRFRRG